MIDIVSVADVLHERFFPGCIIRIYPEPRNTVEFTMNHYHFADHDTDEFRFSAEELPGEWFISDVLWGEDGISFVLKEDENVDVDVDAPDAAGAAEEPIDIPTDDE